MIRQPIVKIAASLAFAFAASPGFAASGELKTQAKQILERNNGEIGNGGQDRPDQDPLNRFIRKVEIRASESMLFGDIFSGASAVAQAGREDHQLDPGPRL